MADTTKNELSRALKNQLIAKKLDKITVTALADECHINRQTFYYHFHDIYELLEWTIEREAVKFATGRPCKEIRDVLLKVIDFVNANEKFIIHAYRSADRYFVKKLLEDGLRPVITQIIENKSKDKKISAEDKGFITDVFVFVMLGITMEWMDNNMSEDIVSKMDKITILIDGNVEDAIERFCE